MQKSGAPADPLHIPPSSLTNTPLFITYSLLTDARYLHEKFAVLKTAGAPTALLETLVADKRVTTAQPVSPRPTTPTPTSPLPLPPSNVPLGAAAASAARPGATLTKRPSLFSNERIKGMLSRNNSSTTAPPAPAPIPVPAPAPQEKQGGGGGGGFKQVVVPLSPARVVQPPESQNGVGGLPDPERRRAGDDVDTVDVDAVQQGDGHESLEYPPPTPAKDEATVDSRTPTLVPVAVGASEA